MAVVTGGTSGLGLATARGFRDEGAFVYVSGRDQGRMDDALAQLGYGVAGIRADSAVTAELERLFAAVRDGHGRVDVVFANAGVGLAKPMTETTPEEFDRVFAVNTRGTFFTVQQAVRLMPDGGSVILGGSTTPNMGLAGLSAYAASKAAIRSFVDGWANELAPRRIRVNLLNPGSFDTPPTLGLPADYRAAYAESVPLGRWGRAEESAKVALFLASDDSSYVNAIELLVDGGKAATRPL